MRKSDFKEGFTLIELLVVIAIIGILATVILASLGSARTKSRDALRKEQVREISKALTVYYQNHGDFTTQSYGGSCGTALTGSDLVMTGLRADGLMTATPQVPSNSGTCGNAYFAGTWNGGQNVAVLTLLENADANCIAWPGDGSGWYNSGSYCDKKYIQVQ
jgi:prepilin-type N-terminal cleavage/methylation domain-containing protein